MKDFKKPWQPKIMLNAVKEKLNGSRELYLRIKARPGASKSECLEIMADGTVKLAIAAPAEKGKANQELIRYLACAFDIPKENIVILSGAGERLKLVRIRKSG